MASPARKLTDFAEQIPGAAARPLSDDQKAGLGQAAAVLRNMPTATKPAYAPGATLPTPPGAIALGKNPTVVPPAPTGTVAGVSNALRSPALLGSAGAAAAGVPEALRVGNVFTHPNASWNDVATQTAEGLGRWGTAGSGAATGAILGAPLGPLGSAVGAVGGGAFGYYAGDKAIRGLRSMMGLDSRSPDEQLRAPVAKAPVAAVAPAAPALPAPSAFPNVAGPGRGSADHPLRIDMDPGRPSLGTARDYTRELSTVPRDLPDGLAPGKVFKTRGANGETVYSGSNVRAGADIVDGLGRKTGVLRDSLSLPGQGQDSPPRDVTATYQRASAIDGQNSNLRKQLDAYGPGAHSADGSPGAGGFTAGTLFDNVRDIATKQGGGKSRAPLRAERQFEDQLTNQREIAQMSNAAALRGQDVAARGQDIGAASAREGHAVVARGQDMENATRIGLKNMEIAQAAYLRRLNAEAWLRGRGDGVATAGALGVSGLDPTHALSYAAAQRASTEAGNKALENTVAPSSVDPDTGKVSEGRTAQNVNAVQKTLPELAGASPERIFANRPQINSVGTLLQNFNSVRRDGLMQRMHITAPDPERSELPALNEHAAERLGTFANWDPSIDAKAGDYKFTKPGQKPIYMSGSNVGTYELGLLRRMGVRFPGD